MTSKTPVILLLADDEQDELREQFAHRYAVDYDLRVANSLGEAMVLAQSLKTSGTPTAMVVSMVRLADATGLVALQCVHAVIPTAKRLLLRTRADFEHFEESREAQAQGRIEAALLLPSGPRDEEFHTAITELLSDWSWTAGHPESAFVVVVTDRHDAELVRMRDFLDRQGIPVLIVSPDAPAATAVIEQFRERDIPLEYPLVSVAERDYLANPTLRELSHTLSSGVDDLGEGHLVDLAIVGSGPAGLAAAVYGASEGLETVVIESDAIGGQAGTSSMIRNYLGFPRGISGMRLAQRARFQASRFGATFIAANPVTGFQPGQGCEPHTLITEEGQIRARSVLVAAGVTYRKLGIESVDDLIGMGVYYGAATSVARECEGGTVVVVGGGNSAGQAAMHLARFAKAVHIVIRRDTLASTMSDYLIREIEANPRIVVHPNTEVVGAGGEGRLQWVSLRHGGHDKRKEVCGLFLLLGANPACGWLDNQVATDERGFVLTGRDVPKELWRGDLPPEALATSVPGVFAAGDTRAGSMKRVASAAGEGAAAVPLIHSWLDSAECQTTEPGAAADASVPQD